MRNEKEIDRWISRASRFHGHLGPFLVIGIRMGNLARKKLHLNTENMHKFRVTIALPLFTPYSCILDGIQITTRCTIGNQKLRIIGSKTRPARDIVGLFETPSMKKPLRISVKPTLVKLLAEKMEKGALSAELARETALMSEKELFDLKKE